MVQEDTIKKCFRKAGVLNSDFSIMVQPFSFDDDPFADLDDEQADREENEELSELISHMQTMNACAIETLIHCEDHIPICQKFADETWEE